MGRNKSKILTKNEKKRLRDGTATHWGEPGKAMGPGWVRHGDNTHMGRSRKTKLDTRQTSTNSGVHAVLFVVLAAIVISWALGY